MPPGTPTRAPGGAARPAPPRMRPCPHRRRGLTPPTPAPRQPDPGGADQRATIPEPAGDDPGAPGELQSAQPIHLRLRRPGRRGRRTPGPPTRSRPPAGGRGGSPPTRWPGPPACPVRSTTTAGANRAGCPVMAASAVPDASASRQPRPPHAALPSRQAPRSRGRCGRRCRGAPAATVRRARCRLPHPSKPPWRCSRHSRPRPRPSPHRARAPWRRCRRTRALRSALRAAPAGGRPARPRCSVATPRHHRGSSGPRSRRRTRRPVVGSHACERRAPPIRPGPPTGARQASAVPGSAAGSWSAASPVASARRPGRPGRRPFWCRRCRRRVQDLPRARCYRDAGTASHAGPGTGPARCSVLAPVEA